MEAAATVGHMPARSANPNTNAFTVMKLHSNRAEAMNFASHNIPEVPWNNE